MLFFFLTLLSQQRLTVRADWSCIREVVFVKLSYTQHRDMANLGETGSEGLPNAHSEVDWKALDDPPGSRGTAHKTEAYLGATNGITTNHGTFKIILNALL